MAGLKRNKSINENLGREILELHTLGVDGGYTQQDVIALANILTGGKVNGGRIIGDWPGLAKNALYEGRDLYPANDLRCLLKGPLRDHLQIAENILEQDIFPQSASAKPYDQLFKAS